MARAFDLEDFIEPPDGIVTSCCGQYIKINCVFHVYKYVAFIFLRIKFSTDTLNLEFANKLIVFITMMFVVS